jgi:hypothetical protein
LSARSVYRRMRAVHRDAVAVPRLENELQILQLPLSFFAVSVL